jgi:hypothetical protein
MIATLNIYQEYQLQSEIKEIELYVLVFLIKRQIFLSVILTGLSVKSFKVIRQYLRKLH